MTIVEFLLARIADDEAAASAKPPGAFIERHTMYYRASEADGFGYVWTSRFRVLAECAAKRQIIKHCTETLEDSSGGYTSGALLAERVLSAMASTYAEHPDYQQDWTV